MNSPGAIRHKLKQVIYRHLKRRLETDLAERPENCVYNHTVMDPYNQAHDRFPAPLHVCIHTDMEVRLCDSRWGGNEKAKNCPYFRASQDKDEVKDEFKEFMRTAPLPEIAAEYPDVAALMWVLGDDAPDRDDPEQGGFFEVDVGPVATFTESYEEAEHLVAWLQQSQADHSEALRLLNEETQTLRDTVARLQDELNESRSVVTYATEYADCQRLLSEAEQRIAELEAQEPSVMNELEVPKGGIKAWLIRRLGGTP